MPIATAALKRGLFAASGLCALMLPAALPGLNTDNSSGA
jgi:hypothetical protein